VRVYLPDGTEVLGLSPGAEIAKRYAEAERAEAEAARAAKLAERLRQAGVDPKQN
jgi:hypothetical protein